MSTSTITPPLSPIQQERTSSGSGMWETNLDDYGNVVEEMLATQRKIDRWIELWQSVEKQLAEKVKIEAELYDARVEINMLDAKLRHMGRQAQDMQTEVVNLKLISASLQELGEEQRQANQKLQEELEDKANIITQILKANEKARRRNLILNHVKQNLMNMVKDVHENPEIVQTKAFREVFKRQVGFQELKQCRLVNQKMYQLASPLLRERSAQVLFDDPIVLQNFLEVMRRSDSIPTGDYKLDETCLSSGNEKLVHRFFQQCAHSMHTLGLSLTDESLQSHLAVPRDLIFSGLRTLFVLVQGEDNAEISHRGQRRAICMAKFIPSLVKAAPNLDKFSLFIAPSMENKMLDKYGKVLQETAESLGEKCKYLELDAQLSDANLAPLRKANRQLVELHLILKESNLSSDALRDFLASQAESLEILKVIYDEPYGKMKFEFPKLSHLKSLTLKGFYQADSVEPIEYEKIFPSLKNFNLACANDEIGNEWDDFFPKDTRPCRSVVEMMLTLTRFDTVSYHRVGKLFPSLKKLRLVVPFSTPEVQESLWCAMPNLEELEYHLPLGTPTCLDELFTGIPADLCGRILGKRSFHDVSVDSIRKRPSLSHLKYLKCLKLYLREHVITDVTGYLALLRMNNLKYLEIIHDGELEITRECLRVMRQRFVVRCRMR